MTSRDFRAPEERLTDQSVYTLQPGEVRLDAGLLGSRDHELGLELGVAVGLPGRVQLEMNVAHAGLGLLNLAAKWNVLDLEHLGLAAFAGVQWANPQLLWILDLVSQDLREDLGHINFINAPIGLGAATQPLHWLELQLALRYIHSEVFGDLAFSSLSFEGGFGSREVQLCPLIRVYLGGLVVVDLEAHLPVWAQAHLAGAAEYEIDDGVRVGAQHTSWSDVPLEDLFGLHLGAEVRLGATHVRLQLDHSTVARILDWQLAPSLHLYWRI